MKGKNATRRAMLLSLTSLLICAAMLVGTTFAWFTDSVTSGTNRIIAGNLDVELEHKTSGDLNPTESVDNATKLFTKDIGGNDLLWEPEVIAYETFTVKNVGSLAFKYNMTLNNVGYNTLNGHSITEVIKVAVATTAPANREAAKALFGSTTTTLGDLTNAPLTLPESCGKILPGTENDQSFTVVLYWPQSDADNTFNANNNKATSDGDPLFVNLGITLLATQVEQESDSFDNQYDATAEPSADPWAGVAVASKTQTIVANVPNTITTPLAPAANKSTTVVFDSNALDEGSATLTVKTEDVEAASAKSFSVVTGNNSAVATVDLSLEVNGTAVTDFADDTAATITTFIAPGLSSVNVLYNGVGEQPYDVTYNAATGELSFKTKHFSQYIVTTPDEAYDDTAKKGYATLSAVAAAVNDGTANAHSFTLLRDVDLNGVAWTPIGTSEHPFSGVFDGKGKTLRNLTATTGVNPDGNELVNAGLFGTLVNATVKNVNLVGAQVIGVNKSGIVAGFVDNMCTLKGISIDSTSSISAAKNVGGMIGVFQGREADYLTIQDCTVSASVTASSNRAGGFIGTIYWSEATAYVSDSVFDGTLTGDKSGGFAGRSTSGMMHTGWLDAGLHFKNFDMLGTLVDPNGGSGTWYIGYLIGWQDDTTVYVTLDSCHYKDKTTGATKSFTLNDTASDLCAEAGGESIYFGVDGKLNALNLNVFKIPAMEYAIDDTTHFATYTITDIGDVRFSLGANGPQEKYVASNGEFKYRAYDFRNSKIVGNSEITSLKIAVADLYRWYFTGAYNNFYENGELLTSAAKDDYNNSPYQTRTFTWNSTESRWDLTAKGENFGS